MSEYHDVVVIGGGIFGCLSAIEASKSMSPVLIIEREQDVMLGATLNNQNRLHLGYHYPRDPETVQQCKRGFDKFLNRYKESIFSEFRNYYFISNRNSQLKFHEYIDFCRKNHLDFENLHKHEYDGLIHNVSGGILTREPVYDAGLLRDLVLGELKENRVKLKFNFDAELIKETDDGFLIISGNGELIHAKAVVNCTYANFNKFSKLFGRTKRYQFELTCLPVVKWRSREFPIGLTLMDGPFFSILPFGNSGNYLLYHVRHSVSHMVIDEIYPKSWSTPRLVIGEREARSVFERIKESVFEWFPSGQEFEFLDYLSAVRVVLSGVDDTDTRPSFVEVMPGRFFFANVFSGKINHSIWLSQEVVTRLKKFNGEKDA